MGPSTAISYGDNTCHVFLQSPWDALLPTWCCWYGLPVPRAPDLLQISLPSFSGSPGTFSSFLSLAHSISKPPHP